MKKNNEQFKILQLERKNNSYYGNPAYNVILENKDGIITNGKTASNASCAYGITNYADNAFHSFTYHFTRSGNLIIDYIRQ